LLGLPICLVSLPDLGLLHASSSPVPCTGSQHAEWPPASWDLAVLGEPSLLDCGGGLTCGAAPVSFLGHRLAVVLVGPVRLDRPGETAGADDGATVSDNTVRQALAYICGDIELGIGQGQEARDFLAAAVEQSPSGILVADAPDVRIRLANPAALSIRGATDRPLTDIEVQDHVASWQVFRPDGTAYVPEDLPLSKAVLQGITTRGELAIIRDDAGLDHWVSVNAAPVRDGAGSITAGVVIFHDITHHVETERELRASQQRFRLFIDSTPDLLFLKDRHLRYLLVNRANAEFFGLPEEEIIGKSDGELMPPEAAAGCEASDKEALERRQVMIATERVGDQVYETRKVPVFDGDEPLGVTGIVRDVTDLARAEEERASLEEQLAQSQKMEAIGRLAGGIAHDFNNLLTGINAGTEMAMEGLADGHPLRGDLEEVLDAGRRAAALTAQLLAFSRKQIVSPEVVQPNRELERSQRMLGRIIGEDIELRFEPASGLWSIEVDPGQLDQVFVNLCVNARDAMPSGGALSIRTRNVHLEGDVVVLDGEARELDGDYVVLEVGDTGDGMEPETQARIFEPFFTTKPGEQATGLGLSTVYGVVRQNNGHIEVESEPGAGTTFRLYFPRAEATPAAATQTAKAPEAGGRETVLMVEDEASVRKVVRRFLEKLGYNVLEAEDGHRALALVEASDEPIDLLLSDVVMPGMDGRDLLERVRRLRPAVGVLFMSGYTDDVLAQRGTLDQQTPFIQKPFPLELLARKVRDALSG